VNVTRYANRDRRRGDDGQSLVEYAVTVPVLLMFLLGMLDFGFAFSHHLTLEYATREGARIGAALVSGTNEFPCEQVDEQVVAAVQRVLVASGSQVDLSQVGEIRIYKANDAGTQDGSRYNLWKLGAGPIIAGETQPLKFAPVSPQNWDACPLGARKNESAGGSDRVDSIGVSITYTYRFVTPLASLMGIVGAGQLQMSDRTVMAMNPSAQ
jgi:hypothetical protein